MNILTFTTLFPNNKSPNSAVFIQHRMAAVHKYCDAEVRVVAPVPWFPGIPVGSKQWRRFAQVQRKEIRGGMEVHHPRYLVTPKIGMTFYGLFMFLGVIATVRRIHREWPVDIIDAHYVYPDGMAAILLGSLLKCPVVVSARGTDINLYPRFRMIRPLIRQVLTKADALISVCRSLADVMVNLCAQPDKVRIIPNGIAPELFYPIKQYEARTRLLLNQQHGRILLTVGSLIELKGIHLLIKALKILRDKGVLDWSTYIVGKGKERKNLEKQIEHAGLQHQVVLVGEVDNRELVYWFNAADLFFLGSSREGWPNVVNEAIACGTPVVATNINGIPDIIHSPSIGIIVERDVKVFAEALVRGMQTKWDRELIQRYGQQRTWEVVAHEVYEVFAEIKEPLKWKKPR